VPWFRFIGEDGARVTLRYRNATVELTFANLDTPGASWGWVARKPNGAEIVLVAAPNTMALSAALMRHGFEVASGSAAEKIMRAAEKCGHAEELPSDELWRIDGSRCLPTIGHSARKGICRKNDSLPLLNSRCLACGEPTYE